MRWHGKAPREPWYYGEAAVANYQFCAWVRENLLSYIYSAAVLAHENGIPIMRSMAVSFPNERNLAAVGDQYLFGEDLLVSPVLNEQNSRTILFPSGQWTSLWDGRTISGPAHREIEAPLDKIPVYLRRGAAMPVQLSRELQLGRSMTANRVNAMIVTPPAREETAHRLNAQDQPAKVTGKPLAHGYGWTLENLPETSHLLVYGMGAPAAVRVAGKALPKRTPAELDSAPAGWAVDRTINRLIVRLQAAQTAVTGSTRQIDVDVIPNRK